MKPEPEGLSTGWLRVTPAPGRTSPISKGIIKRPAARTQDPVRRHPRPRTANPPAGRTVRNQVTRNPSAVPLPRVIGSLVPPTAPSSRRRMPVRTTATPYLHNAGHRTRIAVPHLDPSGPAWTPIGRLEQALPPMPTRERAFKSPKGVPPRVLIAWACAPAPLCWGHAWSRPPLLRRKRDQAGLLDPAGATDPHEVIE